ncbi:MAG TPA: YihY family inner membrane protein, partial [Ectothiorhodospiraceae bacterium]|nr:YihY family inner membrane protein [Ectothiorhodospiraceae bacterium]
MKISEIRSTVHQTLWALDLTEFPSWQARIIRLLRIIEATSRDISSGMTTLRAMSLVYTTLLSLVPLLAVSFSVLKGFGVHNQIEPMLLTLLAPLGDKGVDLTQQIIGFVDNIKVGVLGALGLAFLIYTVISLIQKIERAFNATWRIGDTRSLSQRFSNYLSVVMVGPVLVFSAMGITAAISNSTIILSLSEIEPFGTTLHLISKLLPYLLIIAAFTFVYTLIPNTRVKIRSAFTGAIIAGILWEVTGWLFANFVANSANYTAIYSGFAILMLFMIWLYLSWLILLVGATIAYYHQHPEQAAYLHKSELTARQKTELSLLAMLHIGHHFVQQKTAWEFETLSQKIGTTDDQIEHIMAPLLDSQLLTYGGKDCQQLLPQRPLEQITIKEIIDAASGNNETQPQQQRSHPVVGQLMQQLDKSLNSSLEGMTLL